MRGTNVSTHPLTTRSRPSRRKSSEVEDDQEPVDTQYGEREYQRSSQEEGGQQEQSMDEQTEDYEMEGSNHKITAESLRYLDLRGTRVQLSLKRKVAISSTLRLERLVSLPRSSGSQNYPRQTPGTPPRCSEVTLSNLTRILCSRNLSRQVTTNSSSVLKKI